MSLRDSIGQFVFGQNYIPRPTGIESVYDARIRNSRELAAKRLAANSFSAGPVGGYLDQLSGGRLSKLLSPFTGGNTQEASKHIHNAMHDPQVSSYFAPLGREEGENVMNSLKNNFYKSAVEKLKGGLGDNKRDSLFDKKEFAKGIAHEQEHTDDRGIAKEIAKDHLSEKMDYYTALAKTKLGFYKKVRKNIE